MSETIALSSGTVGLPRGVMRVFGEIRFTLGAELAALAFPDDTRAVSIEEQGMLREWDIATGKQLRRAELSDIEDSWVFNPDGRYAVSCSDTLTIWDVSRGSPIVSLHQPSWITACCFSSDGRTIATGHDDHVLRLWSVDDGRLTAELEGHNGPISVVAFNRDGCALASAAEDRQVLIWDVARQKISGQLSGHSDRIQALSWHPDGHTLGSAGWDTTARLWDTKTGEPKIILNGHDNFVSALAFSPDGAILASADSSSVIWLWDYASGRPIHQLHGHQGEITCLAYSPNGQHLLSGGHHRRLRLWNLETGQDVSGLSNDPDESARISLSPDGHHLASIDGDCGLRIWDTESGELVRNSGSAPGSSAVAYSPDGSLLATGDAEKRIHLWAVESGDLIKSIEGHHSAITSLAFNGSGSILASAGGQDGYVFFWSMDNFEPKLLIPYATDNGSAESVVFLPDSDVLAAGGVDCFSTGGSDGAICLWNVAEHSAEGLMSGGTHRLAVSPDGRQLCAATLSDSFRIWDIETRSQTQEILGHGGPVTSLAYSPDGSIIASGSDDQTVRFWQATNGAPLGVIELDTQVKDLVFSPSGDCVYTANANSTCYALAVGEMTPNEQD